MNDGRSLSTVDTVDKKSAISAMRGRERERERIICRIKEDIFTALSNKYNYYMQKFGKLLLIISWWGDINFDIITHST